MRLVFMGTPDFAVPALRALIASTHEVIAIYTQPPRPAGRGQKLTPSPVQRLAEAQGIPVHHPVSLKSAEVQEAFAAHNADAAIVVAYGLLLPRPILNAPKLGCINVHPSALPRWRGAAPIQRTLMGGDRYTEICIMQMDAGLDTGPVLLREPYPIPPSTTAGELQATLAERAGPLLLEVLAHPLHPVPQPEEGATYAAKIDKAEARIDWSLPAAQVVDRILGLSPSPGAYFLHGEERYKLLTARVAPSGQTAGARPGQVIETPLRIACGEGAIDTLRLQRAGRQAMSATEALKGGELPVGTWLD